LTVDCLNNTDATGFDINSGIGILNDSGKFVGVVPRVPTPYLSGNHGAKSPYKNYANDLGLL